MKSELLELLKKDPSSLQDRMHELAATLLPDTLCQSLNDHVTNDSVHTLDQLVRVAEVHSCLSRLQSLSKTTQGTVGIGKAISLGTCMIPQALRSMRINNSQTPESLAVLVGRKPSSIYALEDQKKEDYSTKSLDNYAAALNYIFVPLFISRGGFNVLTGIHHLGITAAICRNLGGGKCRDAMWLYLHSLRSVTEASALTCFISDRKSSSIRLFAAIGMRFENRMSHLTSARIIHACMQNTQARYVPDISADDLWKTSEVCKLEQIRHVAHLSFDLYQGSNCQSDLPDWRFVIVLGFREGALGNSPLMSDDYTKTLADVSTQVQFMVSGLDTSEGWFSENGVAEPVAKVILPLPDSIADSLSTLYRSQCMRTEEGRKGARTGLINKTINQLLVGLSRSCQPHEVTCAWSKKATKGPHLEYLTNTDSKSEGLISLHTQVKPLVKYAIGSGETICINDLNGRQTSTWDLLSPDTGNAESKDVVRSVLLVPLRESSDELIGVLSAVSADRNVFGPSHVRLFELVGQFVVTAISVLFRNGRHLRPAEKKHILTFLLCLQHLTRKQVDTKKRFTEMSEHLLGLVSEYFKADVVDVWVLKAARSGFDPSRRAFFCRQQKKNTPMSPDMLEPTSHGITWEIAHDRSQSIRALWSVKDQGAGVSSVTRSLFGTMIGVPVFGPEQAYTDAVMWIRYYKERRQSDLEPLFFAAKVFAKLFYLALAVIERSPSGTQQADGIHASDDRTAQASEGGLKRTAISEQESTV